MSFKEEYKKRKKPLKWSNPVTGWIMDIFPARRLFWIQSWPISEEESSIPEFCKMVFNEDFRRE